jgi:DNA replication licensing factor MCM6
VLDKDDQNYEDYAGKEYTEGDQVKYYHLQAQRLVDNEQTTMYIDFDHITHYNVRDQTEDLPDDIIANYYRFEDYLVKAVHQFMLKYHQENVKEKTFFLAFYNLPTTYKLRDMKSNLLGRLQSISGTVTRTTEVRPELLLGAFRDTETQKLYKGIEQQFKLTYPVGGEGSNKYEIVNDDSVFTDWQKLRVQENSRDIPAGSMPRSIDVILRNEIVETAKPGENCVFTGTLIAVPDVASLTKPGDKNTQVALKRDNVKRDPNQQLGGITGLKELGVREMTYKLVFLANSVHQKDQNGTVKARDFILDAQDD